ncbi:hypothetical protein LUW75_16660 [Streptomyces sp. MRC013]|uniref:hypothetical protein n=1 Tax=Streptomyces sp. MRC013 TaxID=2898276 RepID=UPI00202601B2|nr:hypothetical protein [Streptomyces sp. MRC013]URM91335.1 hypothetical protein LUW75_16660 [Streptomyces sp. MRC013]
MTDVRTKNPKFIGKFLVTVVAVATVANITSCGGSRSEPVEPSAGPERHSVDLGDHVSAFTGGLGPRGGYREPVRGERRTVAEGVGLFLDGRRAEAGRHLAGVGFRVRTLTDRATGRRYAEIADATEARAATRGWGRVYVDLGSPSRWSVQVPHPVADTDSEDVGVAMLRGTPGGVLVLAGAHREAGRGDAADVSHRRDTVFHAVCDELLKRGLPGIQVHGFDDATAPGYDAIVSTGSGTRGRAAGRAMSDALRDRGFDPCRAWSRKCPLEGRTNVQGRAADKAGVPFLHVEFSRSVRESGRSVSRVAEAAGAATRVWAAD